MASQMTPPAQTDLPEGYRPWPALWALVIGFFMILVDTTIVSVATPAIMTGLDASVNEVIWVTSAYLLAYAVPLLITGRLGDRLGPKNVYLTGLALFTLSSLWCGLTGTIEQLIIARVVQGLGASMMTPQTMAVITRTFAANRRGQAMSLWGATAGVATLVGPILGGLLIDGPGWEWIFFINVPIGVLAGVMAWRLVPRLTTHTHDFDWLGVGLSAVGMFCIVFGIQEGEKYDWGRFDDLGLHGVWASVASVPVIIGLGLLVFAVFLFWQSRIRSEPLVPLGLFRDRNFSMANIGISTIGVSITALAFPFMLYTQAVRGLSPTESALLMVPMAVFSGGLAPIVGHFVDRVHPRPIAGFGLSLGAVSLFYLSRVMHPDSAVWEILVAMALFGVANAFIWSPLSATATRNLPMSSAGAGAGVYNTTRQVGAVLGSAGVAALIQARLAVELPGFEGGASPEASGARLPEPLREGFAAAMSAAVLLPAAVLLIGVVAVMFFERPQHQRTG